MEPIGAATFFDDRRARFSVGMGTAGCATIPNVVGPSVPVSGSANHRRDRDCMVFEGNCAICGRTLARIDIFFYDDSRFCSVQCRKLRIDCDRDAAAGAAAATGDGYVMNPLRRLTETKERLGRMWRRTCTAFKDSSNRI